MRVALVLAILLTANTVEAQCDASHVEFEGHCCRPGEVVIGGRCEPTSTREPRWNHVASGIAAFVGGYMWSFTDVMLIVASLSGAAGCVHAPCTSYANAYLGLVPFAHLGMLADGYSPEGTAWNAVWMGLGTSFEILGVVLFAIGLVGRDTVRVARGPGLAGLSLSATF